MTLPSKPISIADNRNFNYALGMYKSDYDSEAEEWRSDVIRIADEAIVEAIKVERERCMRQITQEHAKYVRTAKEIAKALSMAVNSYTTLNKPTVEAQEVINRLLGDYEEVWRELGDVQDN